jgi:hypothetical protein
MRDAARAPACRRAALVGRLDAVVDGIADQVVQRHLHLLEDAPVDLDAFAARRELDLFAAVVREVAHELGQGLEQRRERQHQGLLDAVHQLVDAGRTRLPLLRRGARRSAPGDR